METILHKIGIQAIYLQYKGQYYLRVIHYRACINRSLSVVARIVVYGTI